MARQISEEGDTTDLRARIIADHRHHVEMMDYFKRGGWDGADHERNNIAEQEAGRPIYLTVRGLAFYGVRLPGKPTDWYELGTDDQIRPAPTDHLTDEQRRRMRDSNTYYPPPREGECER